MKIGRSVFRAALLLSYSTLSVSAFGPAAMAQERAPAAASEAVQTDDSQHEVDERQSRAFSGEETNLAQPKAWLGIGLKEISGDLAAYLGSDKGVLVESVFPDSPAEAAGIQVGDIVTAINGEQLSDPRSLIEALLKLETSHAAEAGEPAKEQAEDAQRQREEGEPNEAAQKEDEAGKPDDDQQKNDAEHQTKYATVKLTLLRQGKEMTLEVTPGSRPESLALPGGTAEPGDGGEIAELEEMLQELESQGGARVLRFGPPARLGDGRPGPGRGDIQNFMIVIRDDEGEDIEVRMQRVGGERARITVREGDQTRELTEDQIDQLPEKVRDPVRQALKAQAHAQAHAAQQADGQATREQWESRIREQLDAAQRNLRDRREQEGQQMETHRRLRQQLRELPGGHVTILSPEELRKMGQSAEELAAKYQKLAEEMAKRGVQKAQDLAALPEEVKQLQAQVEELKKQVEALQSQIKSDQQ